MNFSDNFNRADATVLLGGTAQTGGASTITLGSGESATDGAYVNGTITITSGTGAGQTRTISAYVGATRIATVSVAWTTIPDATSVYADGSTWVPLSGTWAVVSNQFARTDPSGGNRVVVHDSGSSDTTVEFDVALSGGDDGVVGRASDDNNYLLFQYGTGSTTLYRHQAGGFTSIGSGAGVNTGDHVKLVMSGSTINCYKGSTLLIGPITETFNQTATKHGIRALNTTARFDNFAITDPASGWKHPPEHFGMSPMSPLSGLH
jgi:hypothetical protein